MEPVHIMTAGELIVYSVMLIVTGVFFVCVFLAPDPKGNSMLVLTRKPEPNHDTILIGDQIRIQIQGIIGGKVKIGIDAPQDLRVLRGELVEELDQLNPIVGANLSQAFGSFRTDSLTEDPGGVPAISPELYQSGSRS